MSGIAWKFSNGGGDEICHSSVRARHGSAAAFGPRTMEYSMFATKTTKLAPRANAITLMKTLTPCRSGWYVAMRRFMPCRPAQNMGMKVALKPRNIIQKWIWASFSLYMRPDIFGNQ